MAKAVTVKIRFLGDKWLKGVPTRKFFDIGEQRFWNYKRFPEQAGDGSYLRPLKFYEDNKAILQNKNLFIIEILSPESGTIQTNKAPEIPVKAIPVLTAELAEKGVTEIDGILACPKCTFMAEGEGADKKMILHFVEHEV